MISWLNRTSPIILVTRSLLVHRISNTSSSDVQSTLLGALGSSVNKSYQQHLLLTVAPAPPNTTTP